MKNKKVTYLLLALVAVVWGLIIKEVLVRVNGDNSNNFNYHKTITNTAPTNLSLDTFSIVANYRDPFLGTIKRAPASKKKRIPSKKKTVKKPQPAPKPVTDWSFVQYYGLATKDGSSLAWMQLYGKSYHMKPGETNQNVKLLSINKDSIQVEFKGEKKFIKR